MSACSGRNYNFRCINVVFWRVLRESELTLAQIREKLPNGLADWHQIWHTCANSYGNGYTPNKLSLDTRGPLGGFRGSTIQKSGEDVRLAPTLVHVCGFISEWTYAKSKSPLNTPGGISGRGAVGSHKLKSPRKLSNGCTDWHQIWYTSADSSGNGHRLNTIRPTVPQGHFRGVIWVTHSNVKRLDRLAPHLVQICGFIWEWT